MVITQNPLDEKAIKRLARHEASPAISVLFALDHQRPGNEEDPQRIRVLREQVADRLAIDLTKRDSQRMVARLDEAIASVDLTHPPAAVGVFVADDETSVLPLDVLVEPRVVVARHFAVRDLLIAADFARPVHVIALARGTSRWIELRGERAVQRFDYGFPVEIEPPTEADARRRNFPMGEHEHAEEAEFVFRAVGEALAQLDKHEHAPIVVVGTSRNLAYFDSAIDRQFEIVARVVGDHEHDSTEHLAQLARAELDARRHDDNVRLCADARDAVGTRAVAGIAEVLAAAQAGRGHLLLVEQGYRSWTPPADDALGFDAIEEIVGEVVRHDGHVVEVDADLLADLGHVALLTRY